ncbi:zinc finger protein 704-like [Topomyia yanbarensis]|uniref:zinc finger protein 704-like n=1 Tax=Topomyia yanbarensis TaxID=2498891 RepID=UPI00273BC502|nr:zinc finger protein 704-like [Topomyia yanbarensis]
MKKYFLNKMSTGKRLAKRSIIGTRVCAPGADGIWYSGVIQAVKTPPSANQKDNTNCINLTPNTRYSVRFDSKQDISRRGLAREFRESELIGPGFKTIMDVRLKPGQKVFLTYNGRESAGEVLQHDDLKDEITVRIVPVGQEAPIELTKRLEEVRLLESRRSPRLADQEKDTDFARLADMAGDRRRQSHSIDVPFSLTQQNGSRKRRPSYSQDDREYYSINDDDPMDECNAALVLMSLSCSPNSSVTGWETVLGSSSGSSTTSWSTGSTTPPLSEDGHSTPPNNSASATSSSGINSNGSSPGDNINNGNNNNNNETTANITGSATETTTAMEAMMATSSNSNSSSTTITTTNTTTTNDIVIRGPRTTSFSNSDEGIGMDYSEDMKRKRRASQPIYKCTWKGCGVIYTSCSEVTAHVRNAHLGPDAASDDEDFYFTEIEDESDSGQSAPHPPSPPTLSHRDMARSPYEDPEYQRQFVGNYRQQQQQQQHHHQLQQHHQQHQQHHHQLNAAIKPPLPLPGAPAAGLQQPLHHQALNNNNNNSSSSNNNNNNNNSTVIGQGSSNNGSSSNSSSNGSGAVHPHSNTSPLIHHNYTWSQVSPTSPQKHVRLSPRPSASYPYPSPNYSNQIAQQHHYQQQQQQQQHLGQIQLSPGGTNYHHQSAMALSSGGSGGQVQPLNGSGTFVAPGTSPGAASNRSPLSPNRRTRGENKKCRKVYGMDHKEQWCTQCKWKKACSRFGD